MLKNYQKNERAHFGELSRLTLRRVESHQVEAQIKSPGMNHSDVGQILSLGVVGGGAGSEEISATIFRDGRG